jgi:hypothetical protein
VTLYSYEPLYRQVSSSTDPRKTATAFEPSLGEASAARYTTRFFYDYQEGNEDIPEAQKFDIDIAAVERGLRDLNGDGRADQVGGNRVRTVAPTVQLLADANEAARLGSATQEFLHETQWNDRGQRLKSIDSEGNVEVFAYYPTDDPDGDGTAVATARSTDASGYLRSLTVDAELSTRRLGSVEPTALETVYRYDPVGNIVAVLNPRGVATEIEVNALNELVVVTRGAAIDVAVKRGELVTGEPAFGYQLRIFHDYNGRVTKTEIENRESVSTTEGVGGFVERTFTYDLLDNRVACTVEVDAQTVLTWTYLSLRCKPTPGRGRRAGGESTRDRV